VTRAAPAVEEPKRIVPRQDPDAATISAGMFFANADLAWLRRTHPDKSETIRAALYGAAVERTETLLNMLQNWSGTTPEVEKINRLNAEVQRVLDWIDPRRGEQLSPQQEESHFSLLLAHGVPLYNALGAVKSLKKKAAKRPATVRFLAIPGYELKLKSPALPWSEVAERVGASNSDSLRLVVEGRGGLQELIAALAIQVPNTNRGNLR